jgi:hypothetical protein
MTTALKSVLLSSVILFSATVADAGVARHERVEVKEIKGGMKITLTLRPEGYERARIGIAPAGQAAKVDHREAASDPSKGHLMHQFKEVKFDNQDPKKMELKLMYKDAPNLKPGASFELVSTFNKASNANYWHVYGMTGAGGNPDKFTAPGKAAAKRKSGIAEIRRTGKKHKTAARRRARRPSRQANVRKQRSKQVRKAKPKARARR